MKCYRWPFIRLPHFIYARKIKCGPGERWETARIEKRREWKRKRMRGKERDNSPFPLPHSPSFFCASSMIWTLETTRRLLETIHLHHAAIGLPPPLCNVVPLFELHLGNYKHSNFWTEDGGSMDYFVLLGDSASTILLARITGALWAKQLEANAALCAKRKTRWEEYSRSPRSSSALRKMPRSIVLLYFVNSYSFLSVVGGCDRDGWGSNATWQSFHTSK